jgi:hypothetical protein
MLSAILHDIGKPKSKTGEGKYSHFYHHQDIGGELARKILTDLRYDNTTIDRVSKIVANHMRPHLSEPSSRTVNRMVRDLGDKDTKMVIDFSEADAASSNRPRADIVAKFREILQNTSPAEKITSPISGKEIMEKFNLLAGKPIGEVKEFLTNKVIDGELKQDDKESAYSMAEQFIKEKGLKKSFDNNIWIEGIIKKGSTPVPWGNSVSVPEQFRMYVNSPSQIPKGKQPFKGSRGGMFYDIRGNEKAVQGEMDLGIPHLAELKERLEGYGFVFHGEDGKKILHNLAALPPQELNKEIDELRIKLKAAKEAVLNSKEAHKKREAEIQARLKQNYGIDIDDFWELHNLADMEPYRLERNIRKIIGIDKEKKRREEEDKKRQAEDEKFKVSGKEMGLASDRKIPEDEEDAEMINLMKFGTAVANFEPLSGADAGINHNGSFLGFFDKNNPKVKTALCKCSKGASPKESVENEVASYELFKLLGWKKYCPETVTRFVEEDSSGGKLLGKCSAMKWIQNSERMDEGRNYHTDDLKAILAFDILAWNNDRHGGNSVWLRDKNNPKRPKVYAIDHGYTFDRNFKTTGNGWFNNTPKSRLYERGETELHPEMRDNIVKNIINNRETLHNKLGTYLPENAIDDIIERAKILVNSGDLYVAQEVIKNMNWGHRNEESEKNLVGAALKNWEARRSANRQIWRAKHKAAKQENIAPATTQITQTSGADKDLAQHQKEMAAEFAAMRQKQKEKKAPRAPRIPPAKMGKISQELFNLQNELDEANRNSNW